MTSRGLLLLVCLTCLGARAHAEDRPATPHDAHARSVLESLRAGDAKRLAELAASSVPNRFRVVACLALRAADAEERRNALVAYAGALPKGNDALVRHARAWSSATDAMVETERVAFEAHGRTLAAEMRTRRSDARVPDPLPRLGPHAVFVPLRLLQQARGSQASGAREAAREAIDRVAAHAEALDWHGLSARVGFFRASELRAQGRRLAAAQAYRAAALAAERAGDVSLEARALTFAAFSFGPLGRRAEEYEALLRLVAVQPSPAVELSLASRELAFGRLASARARLKALPVENVPGTARKHAMLQLGLLGAEGRLREALAAGESMVADSGLLEVPHDWRRAVLSLASLHERLGLLDEALAGVESVLADDAAGARYRAPSFGIAPVQAARLLHALGREAEARERLDEARSAYAEAGRVPRLAAAQALTVRIELDAGHVGSARRLADEHLRACSTLGARRHAGAHVLSAEVHLAAKDATAAAAALEAALTLTGSLDGDPLADAYLIAMLGRVRGLQGRDAEAVSLLERACSLWLAAAEGVPASSALPLRARLRAAVDQGFAACARLAAHAEAPRHWIAKAWWFREVGHAWLLAQAVIASGDDRDWARRRVTHEDRVRALAKAQVALVRLQADPATTSNVLAAAARDVEEAHAALATLRRRAARAGAAPARAVAEPVALKQAQADLAADEAALAFLVCGDAVYGLCVRADSAQLRALGQARSLREQVSAWRDLVSTPGGPAGRLGHRLGTRLLVPFRSQLAGVRRVRVLPDDVLTHLPFGALRVGATQASATYVLEQFAVDYVPSATVAAALRERAGGRTAGRGALVLGDPRGTGAEALRGADREARAVGRLHAEDKPTVLLGASASIAAWEAATVPSRKAPWNLIHLACHGRIDPERPLLGGLLLAGDDVLGVPRLEHAHLPARLVVLSGCETARGQLMRGEGVLGLARAFLCAGADRVVVTHWRVADEPTADLMTTFHQVRRNSGTPSAAALRHARLAQLRRGGRGAHPYFWAPFVLWGDAR